MAGAFSRCGRWESCIGLVAVALLTGCGRMPPADLLVSEVPYAAAFSARVEGDAGSLRFKGILASAGTSLRVEIAGGGNSFLLVCRGDELSAVLGREGLFIRDTSSARLLESITGLSLTAADLSAILYGGAPALPDGCDIRREGWRPVGEHGWAPGRIRVTCPGGLLDLRLRDASPLDPSRQTTAFEPLVAPQHFKQAGVEEIAEALREALQGGGGETRPR